MAKFTDEALIEMEQEGLLIVNEDMKHWQLTKKGAIEREKVMILIASKE